MRWQAVFLCELTGLVREERYYRSPILERECQFNGHFTIFSFYSQMLLIYIGLKEAWPKERKENNIGKVLAVLDLSIPINSAALYASLCSALGDQIFSRDKMRQNCSSHGTVFLIWQIPYPVNCRCCKSEKGRVLKPKSAEELNSSHHGWTARFLPPLPSLRYSCIHKCRICFPPRPSCKRNIQNLLAAASPGKWTHPTGGPAFRSRQRNSRNNRRSFPFRSSARRACSPLAIARYRPQSQPVWQKSTGRLLSHCSPPFQV